MKKLFFIAIMVFVVQLHAQVRIDETEAFTTAELFLKQQSKPQTALKLNEMLYSKDSDQPNLFVFSMNPNGFIIVSAMNEILAYSFESALPTSDELPDHINYWLELYNNRTEYLLHHPKQSKEPTKCQRAIEPLLTSIWGQGCFHNADCPVDSLGPCGHASAGCVAIAMAQIMYYHKRPLVGNGSMSYPCPNYGILSANFGQTTYHWEEMTDTLHESNPAVAELVSHCGISVKMQYGAYQSSSSANAALNAFRSFFSYFNSTLSDRSNYINEEWVAMIKENLDKQHPILYTGTSNLGTHAFVCDGYDSNGLFHFNFGWDGVADGYYTIDSPYGFSTNQSIIRDICHIQDIPINSDEHGIIYVSPNGTGDGSSWGQATCEFQSAIFKSYLNDNSIWVKEGHYEGNPDESYAFIILHKCSIYGGFKGDEPYDYNLSLRDFEAYPSILDGNHTQGVINVCTESNSDIILIDGFTIQNGKASKGGGILTNNDIYIKNCKFCFNHANSNGGGFSNHVPNLSVNSIIKDCEFYSNDAKNDGGAVYDCGNSTYLRCRFHNNLAQKDGGAIFVTPYTNVSFINCSISNNTAKEGGGIYNNGYYTTIWSCLINNNTAETGGGCYDNNRTHFFNCSIVKNEAPNNFGGVYTYYGRLKNCIIWGNLSQGEAPQVWPLHSYSYCAVQHDQSGSELNFDAAEENDGETPEFYIRFKDPNVMAGNTGQGGDWRLQLNSYCIDLGDSIPNQTTTDLDGNPRIWNGATDLGAYEVSITNLEEEICEGDTYDFFGTLFNETGHYSTIIGCVLYELDLTVNPLPILHCSNDTIIEQGHSVQLTAAGADTYLWSTGETTESIIVSPIMDTTYSVTGFSQYGCSTTAYINVRVSHGREETTDNGRIILYPNPARNKVEIYIPFIDEVEIINLLGKGIEHINANHEAVLLDVSDYANGVYLIHVKQANNNYYKKLVISH
jgi:hypothetical protein